MVTDAMKVLVNTSMYLQNACNLVLKVRVYMVVIAFEQSFLCGLCFWLVLVLWFDLD